MISMARAQTRFAAILQNIMGRRAAGLRAISSARSRQLTVSSMRRRWACGAFPAIRCRYPRSNQRIGLPTSSTPRSTRNSSSPRRRRVRASSAVTGCACTRRSQLSGSSPGSRPILRGFTVRLLPATGRVRLRSAKQFDSARPKDKTMKTSIATVCLSGGLSEKLQSIAAAGFRGVEIFESDLLSYNGTPADVAKEMSDLGLHAITFQPFRDFEGMPEQQRQRTFERAERKFDLMQELGCDSLLVCSNVSPDSLGGIDRSAADFHELGERAARRGLRVGFEALAWGRHINDYRDAWEVVRRANHPAIGLVLDSFHTFARKTDLSPMRAIPGDRIFLVQLADAPWLEMDVLNWSRHFRCFPGQGDLPLLDFMGAVAATGYQGDLSLEIFNDQFRAGSPRGVAVDGQRSLVYLMDQMRDRPGLLAKAAPQIPPRAKCLGIEFLEFAADDRAAAGLAKLFAGLGFRKVGEHKSKAVTRWSQGAINLVLNSETDGFAHSHQLAHGPSVCAMCLKVDDATATLDHAEKLRDTPFRQAVGPGELEIPAVRGLGGSLIYFVDPKSELGRLWDIDFTAPKQPERNGGAGLAAVDHLSQSMH